MKRSRATAGFTLLELLAAAAIAVVLAAMVLAVTTGTLRVWHRAQDAFTTDVQAKGVLDYLERDLQAAILREDGSAWLAVDLLDSPEALVTHGWLLAPRMKPAKAAGPDRARGSIEAARFGRSGAWLRFFTTNVESGGSLPIAVSYQIARRPVSGSVTATNPAAIRYTLFRAAVSPENTFAAGFDLRAGYASTSATPGNSRTAATVMNPSTFDALATNVVDFGVWLYTQEPSGALRRIHPADETDTSHLALAKRDFPVVADVMVRILTEAGATALEHLEAGGAASVRPADYASDDDWWWAVAEANSRTYVRRIEILATTR
jgi:prepilin-type N-terminal cleavage/methylation domain-containing protein